MPREARDRLAAALAPYRNRDSAFALAVFLARFWSTPSRIIDAFPIDRRELAEHGELDEGSNVTKLARSRQRHVSVTKDR